MQSSVIRHGTACQSVHDSLVACSSRRLIPRHVLVFSWCVRHLGPAATLGLIWSKVCHVCRIDSRRKAAGARGKPVCGGPEELNLQPGELVEVKSEREIRQTLDEQGRHRGLLWMPGMARFCGKRYTVYKRVETIMLESTGELRKIKNTVLLGNVMCENLYGCDRSCFHYWREAWLRRVASDQESSAGNARS